MAIDRGLLPWPIFWELLSGGQNSTLQEFTTLAEPSIEPLLQVMESIWVVESTTVVQIYA